MPSGAMVVRTDSSSVMSSDRLAEKKCPAAALGAPPATHTTSASAVLGCNCLVDAIRHPVSPDRHTIGETELLGELGLGVSGGYRSRIIPAFAPGANMNSARLILKLLILADIKTICGKIQGRQHGDRQQEIDQPLRRSVEQPIDKDPENHVEPKFTENIRDKAAHTNFRAAVWAAIAIASCYPKPT